MTIKQSLNGALGFLVFFIIADIVAIIQQQELFIIIHSLGIVVNAFASLFFYKKYKKLQSKPEI